MKNVRTMAVRVVTALCGPVLLAACDPGRALSPEDVAGSWVFSDQQGSGAQAVRTEERVDLEADGTYHWTIRSSGPGGRPDDGMLASHWHTGSWRLQGSLLVLRTRVGAHWQHAAGVSQVDYADEWRYTHRLRLNGDLLTVRFLAQSPEGAGPYTRVFQRTTEPRGVPGD